jgi:hypothetical protein
MAMKTTQGWGWLAAGVLALGLNGFYHDGGAVWAHRVVDGVAERFSGQSGALVNLVSFRVDQLMGRASLAATRSETASCQLATAMARAQTKMARTQTGMAHFEAMSARQEAALVRMEANRVRIETQVARVRMLPVVFNKIEVPAVSCPRVRVDVPRVNVPRVPMVRVPAPMVHVEVSGSPI